MIVRAWPAAFALLLTPELVRVVANAVVSDFHPDMARGTVGGSSSIPKERATGHAYFFSLFHFLEQLGFLTRFIIIGPDSK